MESNTLNDWSLASRAPIGSKKTPECGHFCDLYQQRHDALTLIKQLIHMVKAVQRHRGMSMAMLGGNLIFRGDITNLQKQLERRLELLQAFARRGGNLMSARDQDHLGRAWLTISHDWQQDSVIDNYELHCHLIEQLLSMIAALGRHFEQPIAQLLQSDIKRNIDLENHQPNRVEYLEVLHFSTRLMPAVAEQIGRIRALATYAAAIGHCDKDYLRKLRYVIQCTRVNNEKLRHQAKRLSRLLHTNLNLLGQLKSYEIKLEFLLTMVESDVLEDDSNADSNRLFRLATDIIDSYLKAMEDGIHLLAQWHEEDLDAWITYY